MSTDISQAAEKTPTDSPETTGGGRIYRPSTDIVETDQGFSMMLEMPGRRRCDRNHARKSCVDDPRQG